MYCITRRILLPFTGKICLIRTLKLSGSKVNFSAVTALFSVIYRPTDDNDLFDRFQKQLESHGIDHLTSFYWET